MLHLWVTALIIAPTLLGPALSRQWRAAGCARLRDRRGEHQPGNRPLTALARARQVMRPAASAGSRARTRAFSRATSPAGMAETTGPTDALFRLVAQKSSKSAKVRSTVISRVSAASRPAPVHSARRASKRDASRLGGCGG